ncbi:flagellar basal body rod protein FlgC [candidate division WOR-1 bacterium RIFOXYB2_FULL_42_35]|uniref:Flagellar basal-body rod protein FlgC n=1 Tax=candidate division WOR-1 bacterium RIFOXYC2_FULL_41_25 TaxID=1802586 RepID=A0A1F4TMC0_UNCSA|nr:MAG: flagellar basal body rod protein FlgC [candidate division WOR-1 bacterium RIFOXYA2_FULL_41_14]OGC22485.1 MAG: flagellar basal body rod protein FlgC [candidate division WOR-1 bacterium RIFOXYB2_FULL_42_35]OGC33223.1 MAG: flagellar basal body rod protein FlgC [candidate division WOR-1 bacterium RIFOXYC2_FULL_41_25]
MSLTQAMAVNLSGIEAERIALELIASNLANINTTRTANGGPYRRKIPVFSEVSAPSFSDELANAKRKVFGAGVEMTDIVEDTSPFPRVYNPGHPDADVSGFVRLPNVNLSKEMVDQIYASRLYEANITAFNATKKMMQDTLQIQ